MITLILACTITTPCIYVEPNPTLPGITNMAGGPGITKDMTHATPNTSATQRPLLPQTPPRHTTTPLTIPSNTPTPHADTQRTQPTQPTRRGLQPSHERVLRQSTRYTVQPGDCLYTIALHYGTTWRTLWANNPGIMDPNLIWPDQVITLP